MLAHLRLHRGFTLLELLTALAVLAVLTTLAVTLLLYGLDRARVDNTVFDVAALYATAQLRATSRGTPHYLILHQPPGGAPRLYTLERPDAPPTVDWSALDLTQEPALALAFERPRPDGTVETVPATERDRLTLATGTGLERGGVAFLDLDSPRLRRPLPEPFSALPLTTPGFSAPELDKPSDDLRAGCSFCIDGGGHRYGVIRFNPHGTVELLTGDAPSGAVLAFVPDTLEESRAAPRLLALSAPAGAIRVFQEEVLP